MKALVKQLQDSLVEEYKLHKSKIETYKSAMSMERQNSLPQFSVYNSELRQRCIALDDPQISLFDRLWPY